MSAKPASYTMYIAPFPLAQRVQVGKLRRAILAVAPGLTECMSYGLPAFAADGKPLLAIGAAKAHCALYPMSSSTLAALAKDLQAFSTSKGTIRFELDKPLPLALIRRIVKLRLKEYKARLTARSPSPTPKTPIKRLAESKAPRTRDRKKPTIGNGVNELLAPLSHPHAPAIDATRRTILAADRRIVEAIKWNAPSFRIEEFFATIHLRAPSGCIQVVLHRGAKAQPRSKSAATLIAPDPKACTLRWPDTQRCIVTLPLNTKGSLTATSRTALRTLIKQWIAGA